MSESQQRFSGINPDLGAPETPRTAAFVPPLAARTAPDKVVIVPVPKYYICNIPNASMHTKAGTRIPFINGFLETSVKAVQDYLDDELSGEAYEINPYIRYATPDEIRAALLRRDPKGVITKEVRAELEPVIRKELEDKIRLELMAQMGLSPADFASAAADTQTQVDASNLAAENLKGAMSPSEKLAQLRSGSVRLPGATLIMDSPAAPLKGIVGSDQLKDAAAGSGGQSDAGASNNG